ncbi:MAG: aldehyde dehydrogenase (NADP(+)), partial [Sediminibacterium sp.]|nr:aldehyde dehydrogenase (NADP(+)) [Sediminibacterium sp.]
VCQAMNHGGPWPSTTNSFHTSVGSDALKRFVKFVSYQNFPQHLLPLELQNENPLNINRTVNNVLTKDPIK